MSLQYTEAVLQHSYVREEAETDFLDQIHTILVSGNVDHAMNLLGEKLFELYVTSDSTTWKYLVNEKLLKHPIFEVLIQDPHTRRSFYKPRGYSGDAEMLDMVYFPNKVNFEGISSIGKKIFRFNTNSNIAKSLRKRIEFISDYIDNICETVQSPDILSVGSGNCREFQFSSSLNSGNFNSFVGIDQDPVSLEEARKCYGSLGIRTVNTSIIELIKGKKDYGKFDLVYSAGLYDYLSNRLANKLTSNLYKMLKPGGRLLIANISQNFPEVGYFESYMGWSMICRDKTGMLDLASDLQSNEAASLSIKNDNSISEHYEILEIIKNDGD